MLEGKKQELEDIQQELDDHTSKYVEADFDLKLNHHKKIKSLLERRDKIIKEDFSEKDLQDLYQNIFTNFDPLREFFPLKSDQSCDFSFLKFLRVDYLDNYKMKVTLELNENDYIENKTLEKTIHLFEADPESTKIIWKNEKGSCPLFDFFEDGDDDFETFDILYEFYVDMLFLAEVYSV